MFESTTRYQVGALEYPSIILTTRMTLLSKLPKTSSDILTVRSMPSQSSCQEMKAFCEKGKYVAVSCDMGTLTTESIEVLLIIYRFRDVKSDVQKQEKGN